MCSMGWTAKQINGMVFSVFPFPLHTEFSIIVFFCLGRFESASLGARTCQCVVLVFVSTFYHYHTYMRTPFPISYFPIFRITFAEKCVYQNLHCTYIRCDFVARNPFFIAAYATMPELFTCKTYLYSIWSKTYKQKIGKMSVSLSTHSADGSFCCFCCCAIFSGVSNCFVKMESVGEMCECKNAA